MSFEKGTLKLISLLVKDDIISLNQSSYLKYLCFRKDPRLLFQINRYINKSIKYDILIENIDKLICNESNSLFDDIFIECTLAHGKLLSREERSTKKLQYSSLTYGEIDYQNFYTILRRLNPIPSSNSIFYDLGSGTGRTITITISRAVIASRLTQDFKKCIGIEILENLHLAAEKVIYKFNNNVKYMLHKDKSNVEIYHASILDYDWSDGDVVFANSTCFDIQLMDSISHKALKLKLGALIITFTKELTLDPLNEGYPSFEILDRTRYNMSWGPATVFINRRIDNTLIKNLKTNNNLDLWKQNINEPLLLTNYFGNEISSKNDNIKIEENLSPPTLDELNLSDLKPGIFLPFSYTTTSSKSSGTIKSLNVLIRAPMDYSAMNYMDKPITLFLHGASSRGSNSEAVKAHALPHILEQNNLINFPSYLICPQCPSGHEWKDGSLSALLIELLDKTVEKFSINRKKIYLTGISMGGLGSWMLAARNPNYFAAMVVMCGGGSPVYAKLLAHMPIWMVHAVNDNVISVNETDALVKALKDSGSKDIQYSRFEECNENAAKDWMIGHNCWDRAYNDRVLLQWLFSKSL